MGGRLFIDFQQQLLASVLVQKQVGSSMSAAWLLSQGSIEKTVNTKVAGSTYTVTGIIVDNTTLRITEPPIRHWTNDYKEFLDSLLPDKNNKDKVPFIEDVTTQGDNEDVYIQLQLSEENMNIAKEEGLVKKFKLTTTIGTLLAGCSLATSKGK